jgi:hypothetical protein
VYTTSRVAGEVVHTQFSTCSEPGVRANAGSPHQSRGVVVVAVRASDGRPARPTRSLGGHLPLRRGGSPARFMRRQLPRYVIHAANAMSASRPVFSLCGLSQPWTCPANCPLTRARLSVLPRLVTRARRPGKPSGSTKADRQLFVFLLYEQFKPPAAITQKRFQARLGSFLSKKCSFHNAAFCSSVGGRQLTDCYRCCFSGCSSGPASRRGPRAKPAGVTPLTLSLDRGAAARNAPLAHRGDDLVQRQIRLLSNQSQQPLHVLL